MKGPRRLIWIMNKLNKLSILRFFGIQIKYASGITPEKCTDPFGIQVKYRSGIGMWCKV